MVLVALVIAACSSRDEPEPTTTTTTTTTPPSTTSPSDAPPGAGQEQGAAEEAPAPEWIVQIGSPQDDALLAVAARDDEVIATGYTAGSAWGTAQGGGDVLSAVVGTDAEIRAVEQSGGPGNDVGFGIGSSNGTTISCGDTESDLGGINSGGSDAWCATLGTLGEATSVYQQGGAETDRLAAVTVEPEGALGYAGGFTLGLFPGASDSSAGQLGQGDAIIWQLNPDGSPRWIRQFGSAAADEGRGLATTEDGDGLIVGSTEGDVDGASNGGTDGFIARFDRDGLPRFIRQFGSDGSDVPNAIASGGEPTRGTETFVTAGGTDSALAPALGAELTDPTDGPRADGAEPAPRNAGGTDAMVVAVDPGGEQRWITQLGSDRDDEATAVAIDGTTVLVAGHTTGVLDTAGNPSAGAVDGFLAALDLETGSLRWITQFGSDADDYVHGMTITEDGLIVVSGYTSGALDDNTNAGGTDGYLIAFPLPSAGGAAASIL